MEVHVQKCQSCGSSNLKNIIFRVAGEADRIYAQCHDCKAFVASYVIAPLGYYHNGKGFESFLRGLNRSGEFMSGRRVEQKFANRKATEMETFEEVLKQLHKKEQQKNDDEQ